MGNAACAVGSTVPTPPGTWGPQICARPGGRNPSASSRSYRSGSGRPRARTPPSSAGRGTARRRASRDWGRRIPRLSGGNAAARENPLACPLAPWRVGGRRSPCSGRITPFPHATSGEGSCFGPAGALGFRSPSSRLAEWLFLGSLRVRAHPRCFWPSKEAHLLTWSKSHGRSLRSSTYGRSPVGADPYRGRRWSARTARRWSCRGTDRGTGGAEERRHPIHRGAVNPVRCHPSRFPLYLVRGLPTTPPHQARDPGCVGPLVLFIAYYDFGRVHSTIKRTPAVAAGLARETWRLKRLLEETSQV
jgi:hypothetical protein